MLAAVRHLQGKLVGLHRTYLQPDGFAKAPVSPSKMALGSVIGSAIHLAKATEKLAIAEGIETALSVMQATNLPTWAALSAGGIVQLKLPPLPIASEVIICADHDESGAGQSAAKKAAQRWTAEGRRVRIAIPPKAGLDFNDMLVEV